jgi:RNA polymerase sigma-70 factor (ECF subfamily)
MMTFAAFDEAYLNRLRSGDSSTQEHFIAYFSQLVRVKASKRVNNPSAVEDICQETFTRALAALRKNGIRQPERLGSFVNSICNHVLQEFYRSNGRETELKDEDQGRLRDLSISAFDQISVREQQRQVRQILDELPEKDRELIRAIFLEERDKDVVCRELGVTRQYLRVLLCRAKQQFKFLYLKNTRRRALDHRRAFARRNVAALMAAAA